MNNSTNFEQQNSSIDEWANLLLLNHIVYRGYFLFLILAGTCGNSLTAITLLRAKLRKHTTCQFMAVCALLNIGVLLTNTSNMMLTQGFDIHLRSQFSFAWCRFNAFVAQWIRGVASWMLVVVAFDRYRQSKQVRRPLTKNKYLVLITFLITSAVLLVLNLHYLFFTGNMVTLDENTLFLACIFDKSSNSRIQNFFASTSRWQELVTYIIVPCILTMILNIFIIKNSFLNPINNERLKSRSRSRTRRLTTMLLASNIGFLALVGPAQIFVALAFDPQRGMESNDQYKSFIIPGYIFQCLINTYYAASFVFCFASSSIFRREMVKLFTGTPRKRNSMTNENPSTVEGRPFLLQSRLSCSNYAATLNSTLDPNSNLKNRKSMTESIFESDIQIN